MNFSSVSSTLLFIAFVIYTIAIIVFAVSVMDRRGKKQQGESTTNRTGLIGFIMTLIGFISQVGYFFTRWVAAGHIPVSDLFEYTTFFSMMMVLAFIIIYLIYQNNGVGLLTLPIVIIIIAYASVFPTNVEPLIPALQSNWLKVHVTTVALGEGILAISFAAGLVYLIRVVDQTKASKRTFWLEVVMYSMVSTLAYVFLTIGFGAAHYQEDFKWVNHSGDTQKLEYHMPAIAGPYHGEKLTKDGFGPLFPAPSWMNGMDAPLKFNTMIWSFVAGFIFYWIIRLILRRRIAAAIQVLLKNISPPLLDEISYRAVAIGFPIFTLGGIVFASIWAEKAWSRFWGWDPKEVWALITFLFYAAYLHLRLTKGWIGEKSAWLTVIGFVIIMFNLIAVNLVLVGLHSYA